MAKQAEDGWIVRVLGIDPGTLPPSVEQAAYQAARRAMRTDENAARRVRNPGPGRLSRLRDTYLASAATVDAAVTGKDWIAASAGLAQLRTDLAALLRQKNTELADRTEPAIRSIKDGLAATNLRGQAVVDRPGGNAWCAVVEQIAAVQLDRDFTARYDRIDKDVGRLLAADPVVQDAHKRWGAWQADLAGADPTKKAAAEAKALAAMKKVIALQCQRLGIDPPTPVNLYDRPDPTDCGGYAPGTNTIGLNRKAHGFDDFREVLDTLTHENTHAFQTKLITGFRDGTLTKGDPDYVAAMVLDMNDTDTRGYISPDAENVYRAARPAAAGRPYFDQACEKHAVRSGEKAGQAAFAQLEKAAKAARRARRKARRAAAGPAAATAAAPAAAPQPAS